MLKATLKVISKGTPTPALYITTTALYIAPTLTKNLSPKVALKDTEG